MAAARAASFCTELASDTGISTHATPSYQGVIQSCIIAEASARRGTQLIAFLPYIGDRALMTAGFDEPDSI